ncbi:NAD(P)H-quinone oxidoreductase [Paenibacillus soyae]|uniref:NAD(P)H-quinone oxidoreductase n=1 Tax=Paenibacillus soyae TaxID=2969249 RepID=A0A9X2MLF0_9BACL|nr:NAD(P)H-quinone oxidoreductase [Paenibacillus soyae]MCR2802764.1 NAD(P)H-quinone oxidoreductase [Paenibacillus soyae]
MKAIQVHEETRRLYIDEVDGPSLTDGELLVRVRATALNRADLLQKRGLYPPPPGATDILGLEMAGVVEEGAGEWKKGDLVMALLPGGGYAERVRIPANMAMSVPEGFTFAEAAAIPEVFLTAYLNLIRLGALTSGQTVLIHAGASGVGTAAIQLAKARGATVIVTAGSQAKREACLGLGADLALDYHEGPFLPAVREYTQGRGVNVVMDFAGASYWEQNVSALALDGKLILVGLLGGSKAKDIDLGVLLSRRLQVIGSSLRTLSAERKAELTAAFASDVLPLFRDGRMKPVIDSEWDWSRAQEAHEHMEQNRNIGKIILNIS